MSAIFALEDIIVRLEAQKIKLYLVIPNEKVFNQIQSLEIGENALFADENEAINQAVNAAHLDFSVLE